ncbi:MAG: triose-phosphate isomerase, partial [Deltaproteobacteria bacterium]|nr:triose-phosphate isomerase [Deltaproteobacteria bacterium]
MQLLMAANWKMYKTGPEAAATLKALQERLVALPEDRRVLVFAPFTALADARQALDAFPGLSLGAQNCYPA